MKMELKNINNIVKMPIFSNIKDNASQNKERKYKSINTEDHLKLDTIRKTTFEK